MSNASRYRVQRGQRARNVDVIDLGAVERVRTVEPPARVAQGSRPDIVTPPVDDDTLAALAEPSAASRALRFGAATLVVEIDERGVSLVVPAVIGAIRVTGSAVEAHALAQALRRG